MSSKIFLTLAIGVIFFLPFALISEAIADYQPPPDQKPPKNSSKQLGSRGGCNRTEETSLQLLAPQKYVGKTVSLHPTFAWLFRESESFPLEFRLYQYDLNDKLILLYQFETKTKPNIMTLSLPKEIPDLVKGERYLWQVAILCNPNYPSQDLVAVAEFEITEMPANLAAKLSQTKDKLTRSDLYADKGLWYDALNEAILSGDSEYVNNFLKLLN